jgi:hypothetical protein
MFNYFGYGSNMNLTSLRAKGVVPRSSQLATLHGWNLCFDVKHWFRHEGGVGNIRPSANDRVQGVVHVCEDQHLAKLDAVESFGVGYDRIEVELETFVSRVRATTYVGLPGYLDTICLPTRRYLNILVRGASQAGLDPDYIERLRTHPTQPEIDYPPFEPPFASSRCFDAESLANHPRYTALAGAVFDMQNARPRLHCLFDLFGGKDMTLFHLKRVDTSDGNETLEQVRRGEISESGHEYLNAYLHEYAAEFEYVGRFDYDKRDATP